MCCYSQAICTGEIVVRVWSRVDLTLKLVSAAATEFISTFTCAFLQAVLKSVKEAFEFGLPPDPADPQVRHVAFVSHYPSLAGLLNFIYWHDQIL